MGNADVVHVHDVYYESSVLAATLAKWRRRPIFITQNVGIVDHDKAIVEFIQKLVYASVGRLLWRWAVKVTVYNPIVDGFLRKHGVPADKVRLTYNGIDTVEFRPGEDEAACATRRGLDFLAPEVPAILFAGRLVPKKGFQKLLDASGPEYQIVLAGPGRIPGQVPDGVKFIGPLHRKELRDLYQASDLFAFPATGEMFTLAMQEAMACGLPVVATAEEAYSGYDLDSSGIALVPAEPKTLRSTFLAILGDPGRREWMQAYSRRLAEERFDWKKNTEHLAADYEAACEPRRPVCRSFQPAIPEPSWPQAAAEELTTARER